jgi:hypothetical protein
VPYLKGRLKLVPGDLHLTGTRLVHTSTARAVATIGLVGALASGRIDLDLPLDDVARIAHGRHGRNDNVLAVTDVGGREHRFLAGLDEWLPALRDALLARGRRVEAITTGEWAVGLR